LFLFLRLIKRIIKVTNAATAKAISKKKPPIIQMGGAASAKKE